jgi:hypothetical protein
VAHVAISASGVEREVVYASTVVVRDLQLIAHVVSRDLSPNMRLAPTDPSTTHLEGVTLNIG